MQDQYRERELKILRNKKEIVKIRPIIRQWQENICSYAEAFEWRDSIHWWDDEDLQTGVLAAAAWQKGYFALERGRVTGGQARPDLRIFGCGKLLFVIEAKYSWYEEGEFNQVDKSPMVKINEAIGELLPNGTKSAYREEAKRENAHLMIIVFVAPCFPKEKTDEESLNIFKGLMSALENEPGIDFYSWVFPEELRSLRNPTDNKICPGMIMVGKII